MNESDAHLGYFRLFLGRGEDWEEPTVVGLGCSVRVKGDGDEQWWQILECGEQPYGLRELSPDDDLAKLLMGCGVGDTFKMDRGFGASSYEIIEIQSKFVRAYQETLEEFSFRFPDNMSLERVALDRDFSQVFQSIERRQQHVLNAEGLYQSGKLPFASFCSLIGSTVLEVWPEYTAQPTTRFRFSTGSDQETSEAFEKLHEGDAIVLDMVALLSVHRLGIADHLRKRFSRVAIPQQVFDEIQNCVYASKVEGNPSSYLGKDEEGRYTHTEITENAWKERRTYGLSVLKFAESFERIPSYPLLDADEPEKTIDALTSAGASAVYFGDEHADARPVLVADDLLLSQVAQSLGFGAGNSQTALIELLDSGSHHPRTIFLKYRATRANELLVRQN